jgi:undecaprenyl-diphosphatase
VDDYLASLLLGVVEGLTEFLPVSSTAHLRIAQAMLQIDLQDGYWKMYAVVIQLGAILALPVYFRTRILRFIATFPRGEQGDRTWLNHPLSLTAIAFVVTAVPAFLLRKVIGENLENLFVIAWALIIGGVIMWVVDTLCRNPTVDRMEAMTLPQAIWIGAVQVLSAVFPGTSRSMSTIAAGQLAGLSRTAALEFSFFLSIPIMAVATSFDLLKTLRPSGEDAAALAPVHMGGHEWTVLGIGFFVSFIVALGVTAWFMAWVRRHGFVPFAIYRIVAGSALLAYLLWPK